MDLVIVEASTFAVVYLASACSMCWYFRVAQHRLASLTVLFMLRFWSVVCQQMLLAHRPFNFALIVDCIWYSYNLTIALYMVWTESWHWGLKVSRSPQMSPLTSRAAGFFVWLWFWGHFLRLDNLVRIVLIAFGLRDA